MIYKCVLLLCTLAASLPLFAAQHVAVRPKPSLDASDQATIREIIDMERQAKKPAFTGIPTSRTHSRRRLRRHYSSGPGHHQAGHRFRPQEPPASL